MNSPAIASDSNPSTVFTYAVAIRQRIEGSWTATALGWWNCQAEGTTREEALIKLNQLLAEQLAQVEIVQQTLSLPKHENPLLKLAGKYKDDPDFDEVIAAIADYRREIDAELLPELTEVEPDHKVG